MILEIPDPIAKQAGLDEKAMLQELALTLFAQERLSGSQVRALCGLGFFEFMDLTQQRGLPSTFVSDEEGQRDLDTLKNKGWL
jgi:predicted HTH domain antitoxin